MKKGISCDYKTNGSILEKRVIIRFTWSIREGILSRGKRKANRVLSVMSEIAFIFSKYIYHYNLDMYKFQ